MNVDSDSHPTPSSFCPFLYRLLTSFVGNIFLLEVTAGKESSYSILEMGELKHSTLNMFYV
jgi:hypothetical protein